MFILLSTNLFSLIWKYILDRYPIKVKFGRRLRAFADSFKFSCRVLMCWAWCMRLLIFMTYAEKQPRNLKLPPTCSTLGTIINVFGFEGFTYFQPNESNILWPKISSFVSSDQRTDDQNLTCLSRCLSEKDGRALMCKY